MQARVFAVDSAWLLDQVGVRSSWRVVDVGCGPQGVLDLMAARVGTSGAVVGLEQNPEHAALAAAFCRDAGLANVTIVNSDAVRNPLPKASFDLAHERAVLVNVPNPTQVLAAMVELVQPGGMVACDDLDQSTRMCEPPHPAWDRLNGLILDTSRRDGADPFIGRRLPALMRQAGLEDVKVRLRAPEFWDLGHPRRFAVLTMVDNMREAILGTGRISEDELEEQKVALRQHLEDAETIAVSGLWYQVWGRRPS